MAESGAIVAEVLVRADVSAVFCLAGSDIGGILHHCLDRGIRVVTCRDERTAGFMASAYGALARKPGICVVPEGPGFTNAITGLLQGQLGGWPVVSIAGAYPRDQLLRGALQEIDQVAIARPVSKWAQSVPTPGRLADLLGRALDAAMRPPYGHAHLSIPGDVLSAPADEEQVFRTGLQTIEAPAPSSGAVDQLVELLTGSQRPVLVVGANAWFARAGEALVELADRLMIPTFSEDEARGMLPDTHPASLGSLAFRLNGAAALVERADLVVAVGVEPDWRVEYLTTPLLSATAKFVPIDSRVDQLGRNRDATLAIWADERAAIEALVARLPDAPAKESSWLLELRAARDRWCSEVSAATDEVDAVSPATVAQVVAEVVGSADANLTIDGGHIGKWTKAFVHAARPGQVSRLKGGLAAIGHGLPSAMVRRLTDPGRASVLVTGDGAFGYGVAELESSVTQGLPVIVVVAVDGAWGSVSTQLAGRYGAAAAAALPRTAFEEVAKALGAQGESVSSRRDLRVALERAIGREQTTVIAVRTFTVASPASYPGEGRGRRSGDAGAGEEDGA